MKPTNINKKNIIFIFIVIVALSIFVYLIFINKNNKTTNNILPAIPSSSAINSDFQGKLKIKIDIKYLQTPSSLPEINTAINNLQPEYYSPLAKNLGYPGDPIKANDVFDGTTLLWVADDYTLIAYPQKGMIRYANNQPNVNNKVFLSEDDAKIIANSFLVDNHFFGEDQVVPTSVIYLGRDKDGNYSQSDKSKAELVEVDFGYKTMGYEIFASKYTSSPINIQLNSRGEIFSMQALVLGEFNKSAISHNLKNLNEINSTLDKSILFSIQGVDRYLPDINDSSIGEVTIKEIKVIYLLENGKNTLIPYYKLVGTTSVQNYGESLPIILFLEAIN